MSRAGLAVYSFREPGSPDLLLFHFQERKSRCPISKDHSVVQDSFWSSRQEEGEGREERHAFFLPSPENCTHHLCSRFFGQNTVIWPINLQKVKETFCCFLLSIFCFQRSTIFQRNIFNEKNSSISPLQWSVFLCVHLSFHLLSFLSA